MSKVNKTAVLIDGGFFFQRFRANNKKRPPKKNDVEDLISDIMKKVTQKSGEDVKDILFRTYYYDCLPFSGEVEQLDKKGKIDFSATKQYKQQCAYVESLRFIE